MLFVDLLAPGVFIKQIYHCFYTYIFIQRMEYEKKKKQNRK